MRCPPSPRATEHRRPRGHPHNGRACADVRADAGGGRQGALHAWRGKRRRLRRELGGEVLVRGCTAPRVIAAAPLRSASRRRQRRRARRPLGAGDDADPDARDGRRGGLSVLAGGHEDSRVRRESARGSCARGGGVRRRARSCRRRSDSCGRRQARRPCRSFPAPRAQWRRRPRQATCGVAPPCSVVCVCNVCGAVCYVRAPVHGVGTVIP